MKGHTEVLCVCNMCTTVTRSAARFFRVSLSAYTSAVSGFGPSPLRARKKLSTSPKPSTNCIPAPQFHQ